jgi:hypothetical protein
MAAFCTHLSYQIHLTDRKSFGWSNTQILWLEQH